MRLNASAVLVVLAAFAAVGAPATADPTNENSAGLAGAAFGATNGVMSINEAAGAGNQQANVAVIALNVTSDAGLASVVTQTRSGAVPSTADARNRAFVGAGAFAGASGVAQLNQAAGDGNATFNAFALHVGP